MWDWKLAQFHSFARHVEFTEFRAQFPLNSRAMCAEKLWGGSWREERTEQLKWNLGFIEGSSCVEFVVDSLSLLSEAFLRFTFRAASWEDPHVTAKEAMASVVASSTELILNNVIKLFRKWKDIFNYFFIIFEWISRKRNCNKSNNENSTLLAPSAKSRTKK